MIKSSFFIEEIPLTPLLFAISFNAATVNLDKSTFSFSIDLDFSTFFAGFGSVLTGLDTAFSTFLVFLAPDAKIFSTWISVKACLWPFLTL